MFNEAKTAQAAAYLIHKAGGIISHLKLIKLLYLADRLSWQRFDSPITGDEYYSLKYGPVLSRTLDLIHGETESREPTIWNSWISARENHQVSLMREIDAQDKLFWDELSANDEKILDDTFRQYGHLDRFELVELTHNSAIIPEWEDPKGGAIPIKLATLLSHLGKNESQIKAILDDIKAQNQINALFSECRGGIDER